MKHNNNLSSKEQKIEVDSKLSAVASNPKKSVALLVIILIALSYLIYNFIWKGNQKSKLENKPEVSKNIITEETPKIDINAPIATAPALPEPPEITAPEAPPAAPEPAPAPIVQVAPPAPIVTVEEKPLDLAAPIVAPIKTSSGNLEERRRSPMIKMGGSGGGQDSGSSADGKNSKTSNASDSYTPPMSPNFLPSKTSFNQQAVTQIGNMKYVVAQGKLIDAVLESAITTDFPGVVRAIVSRDVYSEIDKNVLIPKGSRLIGNFASDGSNGKVRVAIGWTRIIRPDGIDINVNSPAVDTLGRSAIKAEVDAKIANQLASALISMIVKSGAAAASDGIMGSGNDNITSTSTNNPQTGATTTSTTSTTKSLVSQSIQGDVSNALQSMTNQFNNTTPTLYVNQGTQIKVFVNRDLMFSQNAIYKKNTQ